MKAFLNNTCKEFDFDKVNFKQEEKRKHFLNTLTADGEYFRHNSKSLLLPIQVQLSKKVKTFC